MHKMRLIWRETKKGFKRKYLQLIFLVGREGFEPSANGLKVRCWNARLYRF